MIRTQRYPAERIPLEFGDFVKFAEDRNYWSVRGLTDNFVLLRKRTPFTKEASEDAWSYTILDWRNGIRGPSDWIGNGFGDGVWLDREQVERDLQEDFEDGSTEISARRDTRIRIASVNGVAL